MKYLSLAAIMMVAACTSSPQADPRMPEPCAAERFALQQIKDIRANQNDGLRAMDTIERRRADRLDACRTHHAQQQ
jgi:hypothetical protein